MNAAATTLLLAALVEALGQESGGGVSASARVLAEQAAGFFRHTVSVKNTSQSGELVSAVIGREPGLVDRPVQVSVPKGWRYKLVEDGASAGKGKMFLVMTCDKTVAGACLAPGKSRSFDVVLPHRSASIFGPVFVEFAGGESVVAKQ